MAILFPSAPSSGKNAKIYMSRDDGIKLNSAEMTLKSSYKLKGEVLADLIYVLGSDKTLINMRPALQPRVDIDAVLAGCEIIPTETNDKVLVTAGIIEVDGAQVPVSETELTLTRPTNDGAWVAIKASKTGVVTEVKGIDGTLEDTYGVTAGKKPYIGVDDILLGIVKLANATPAVIPAADIDYNERETSVESAILPNIGGVRLTEPLQKVHTGGVGRKVKFTGNYLDKSMTKINSGKNFNLNAKTDEVSETTFENSYGESTVSGYSFTFEQLATDSKTTDAAFERGGHCAVRFVWPNGYYQQSVGTLAPSYKVDAGSYNSVSVAGQCADFPVQSSDL